MNQNKDCSLQPENSCACSSVETIFPSMPVSKDDEPCCGSPPGPEASPFEKPGYKLCGFVDGFGKTAKGFVPAVKARLSCSDIIGTIMARMNILRNNYKISPGLYQVGEPDKDSLVLVTANYKLSFDSLRKELPSVNAWILVLDTRGINVWCAAGKGTFSTEEVIRRVQLTGLDKLVQNKKLILPQLSATGVSAHKVKRECGFKVIWGPLRAKDLKKFLHAKNKAEQEMRRVTFSFFERIVLIPVEVSLVFKPLLWIFFAAFILSGIGPNIFSFTEAWSRSLMVIAACGLGIMAGAVIVPALLPWIPGAAFSFKGAIIGLPISMVAVSLFNESASFFELFALLLCSVSVSSYLAMNFTGSTPFTSPSGVEKEMRKAIPAQAGVLLIACIIWVSVSFSG